MTEKKYLEVFLLHKRENLKSVQIGKVTLWTLMEIVCICIFICVHIWPSLLGKSTWKWPMHELCPVFRSIHLCISSLHSVHITFAKCIVANLENIFLAVPRQLYR